MHPIRKRRLWIVLFIALGSSAVFGLVIYALNENLNYFYPPSKMAEAPVGRAIRAGGCVLPGSVVHAKDQLKVDFVITDGQAELPVTYNKILPALFGEGEAAVMKGKMRADGVFEATQVLAKHDENYTPTEVSKSVKANTEQVDHSKDAEICKGLNYGT